VSARITAIGKANGLLVANVFHAGDGNLHPNICYDSRDSELTERVHRASREIMSACVAAGGFNARPKTRASRARPSGAPRGPRRS